MRFRLFAVLVHLHWDMQGLQSMRKLGSGPMGSVGHMDSPPWLNQVFFDQFERLASGNSPKSVSQNQSVAPGAESITRPFPVSATKIGSYPAGARAGGRTGAGAVMEMQFSGTGALACTYCSSVMHCTLARTGGCVHEAIQATTTWMHYGSAGGSHLFSVLP